MKPLGLPWDAWAAIGTAVVAGGTIALVIAALLQARSIRQENRKARTLSICGEYDTSPVLSACKYKLWKAKEDGSLEAKPEGFAPELVTVLNYLDAIAIGIQQNLYIEALAWDHLQAIVEGTVKDYIDTGTIDKAGVGRESFRRLIDLRERWARVRPRFQDNSWF